MFSGIDFLFLYQNLKDKTSKINFSKTYKSVEDNTDKIWKMQRYQVIYEYFHKPTLPPPFVLLTFLVYPLKWTVRIIKALCLKNLTPSDNFYNKVFFSLYQKYNNGFSKLHYYLK